MDNNHNLERRLKRFYESEIVRAHNEHAGQALHQDSTLRTARRGRKHRGSWTNGILGIAAAAMLIAGTLFHGELTPHRDYPMFRELKNDDSVLSRWLTGTEQFRDEAARLWYNHVHSEDNGDK